MKELKSNKKIKIGSFYLFTLLCLVGFFYLNNSDDLVQFHQKADNYRTSVGFGFIAVLGLIKYTLLLLGVAIPIIMTSMII